MSYWRPADAAAVERARRICSRPSTSFHEQAVARVLTEWADGSGIPWRRDAWGNLHVGPAQPRGGRAARGRALLFTAHMDHPGFVVSRSRGRRAVCRWFGGVSASYFKGSAVRVERWAGDRILERIRGRITRTERGEGGRVGTLRVLFDAPVHPGEIGTWDVVSFRRSGRHLWTRAADDLMGCAAITLALDRIRTIRGAAPVGAIFTRAEEVGLVGATALAREGGIPRHALVIVLETSKEIPRARQGMGPVVRVGDLRSVFDPGASHFLHATAQRLAAENRSFRYQRCLMDGGTCEASSFGLFGSTAGALALPLVNYHNMGPRKIAAERIDLDDLRGVVALLAAAAVEAARLPSRGPLPPGDSDGLLKSYRRHRRALGPRP